MLELGEAQGGSHRRARHEGDAVRAVGQRQRLLVTAKLLLLQERKKDELGETRCDVRDSWRFDNHVGRNDVIAGQRLGVLSSGATSSSRQRRPCRRGS